MNKWLEINWYHKDKAIRFNLSDLKLISEKPTDGRFIRIYSFEFSNHIVEITVDHNKEPVAKLSSEIRNIFYEGFYPLRYREAIVSISIDGEQIKDWEEE